MPDDEVEPTTSGSGFSRRNLLVGASAASVLAAAGWPGAAQAAPRDDSLKITIMGTSDLHSNAVNWDYYKDATYSDRDQNAIGLARVSSVVKQIREKRGRDHTLLFDAGDTIQGSPLGFYYALVDPVTESGATHPIAAQMNAIGYDAVALGNHEFNYGLEFLDYWISQMDADVLAANAVHAGTKVPAFTPYTIKTMKVKGRPPVRVGVLGLTNPGVVIWDKANVSGKIEVLDLVEAAARWVPVMRREGADVVVVSAHSGESGTSSYGSDLPVENAAKLVAEQVPGIDAILFGHAHVDVPERLVTNTVTGKTVVMSEPKNWGQRLSVFDLDLEFSRGKWSVTKGSACTINTNTVVDDPELVAVVRAQHEAVVKYVNTPVAVSTQALSAAEACWKDTAILDYVNEVQTATVAAAVAGTPEAALPIVSIAAPFNRGATFPAGEVTIKDVAGLYIYDNTLMASVLTGAQIKEYLEYSAKYFKQVAPDAPVDPAAWTNAPWPTPQSPTIPDYNYDQFSGVDYGVDISQPVGSRIVGLSFNGAAVAADQKFLVAVNNYRQSGGGGFPHIATAPVVYNAQVAIREAIVSYASAQGTIDPADFHVENWRLVRNGTPVV
ncbi:2',3'-cyclic-nucleotide 2'-phosphodiesterase/3'-nucleotidase [Agromyces flavus]|uniref:2',3'-cyclic-nucleotide 2'-phosphodiesterase / 3'-nucleotidase n=1 Tax=Agromyces flavus TaxID=589382 RepID=A0A1H1PGV6_9MICO|nr:5'-nucleotidase C-terminal domain-containing protein [Agromyces flavus]MCP2367926.1 2',3'-cyclic-nucleotide 2'-phosphodiesterase/3'-nucleotidase [Agromyces flavus]GGI47388.1 multifunctional 2',3'-cyclic-nucleotide 2'-phosphodiesterase/5'-nucleotidase/3'-nucleotidase [Agromyces flavus]SDS10255.1 2',3'-cyclic-nucleotide 2'-phosphodiesterase / 3'-nucleotidase [Agromyces flavus]